MSTKAQYNIGELAHLAGVSIRTLRHYDDIGLLTPSSRAENSYRSYTEEDCQRLFDILFYPCPRGMHANLGEMYVQDERYAAYFEKIRPGMARFVRDAIVANR